MDVAAHRGLGVLHPPLFEQLVDHQEAVVLLAPPRDLLPVSIERVLVALLRPLLLVVYLLQLLLGRQLLLLIQPPLLLGELQHLAYYTPVLAGLPLDRLDRLLHPQSIDDIL